MTEKKIIIIAGPNGAGKTTFADEFLAKEAGCPIFINADLIAYGLEPSAPDSVAFKAGRIMLAEIRNHVCKGESFAFETTLSGRRYSQLIPHWQSLGYHVILCFLKLASPEAAIARVRQRVSIGGHDIPEPVIRRRFAAGLRNLEEIYKPIVDKWAIYDNSGSNPFLLDEGVG
ncbi:MAG: zeta toxin family protein [Pseudohongiellaceae bacterium]